MIFKLKQMENRLALSCWVRNSKNMSLGLWQSQGNDATTQEREVTSESEGPNVMTFLGTSRFLETSEASSTLSDVSFQESIDCLFACLLRLVIALFLLHTLENSNKHIYLIPSG